MPHVSRLLLLLPLWLTAAAPMVAAADSAQEPRSSRGSSAVQGRPPPAIAPRAAPAVRVDARRALGSADAPLAIVEFADYQCPYCRRFHFAMLPRLRAEFVDTGKVRYFYKDFPLPNHEHAFGASVAAHCAGEQGRYWEMVDSLYGGQARLGRELYRALALKLGLDARRFGECLGAQASQHAVRADVAEARRLGVRATPTFVIGRLRGDRVLVERMASGIPTFEQFAQELELLGR